MDIQKFNNDRFSGKKLLFAPLDWGLGHATRCIPIINALLKRDTTVIIAAFGQVKAVLAPIFPQIRFVDLPQYRVTLGRSAGAVNPALVRDLPRLWRVMKAEKRWLDEFCRNERIDLIISDNRYGLYHQDIPCIFITHQLSVRSGLGGLADRWLLRVHFRLIGRFRECWVPDIADPGKSLAGRLSHPPRKPPFPVIYLGLLSRFAGPDRSPERSAPGVVSSRRHDLLVLLSGPEPQRSMLEKIIVRQLQELKASVLLVRGLPDLDESKTDGAPASDLPGLTVVNHLPPAELQEAILLAGTIVCRSGYSTIMDLIALRRTAVLIPTPGQAEQEWLAMNLQRKGWMTFRRQNAFSLAEVLTLTNRRDPGMPSPEGMFFNGDLPSANLP